MVDKLASLMLWEKIFEYALVIGFAGTLLITAAYLTISTWLAELRRKRGKR